MVRSDRDSEYVEPFSEFYAQHGIIHTTIFSFNCVAECKNCILKDTMNAMLISYGLSQNMWGEAIL